jgi:hypothetical protein
MKTKNKTLQITEPAIAVEPVLAPVFKFGDYCTIEQHRFGANNEHYHHKVIGTLKSTAWVEVPVMYNPQENNHDELVDVVACVCEGVDERHIFRYRAIDCKPLFK